MRARYARAGSELERLAVAYDYARAATRAAQTGRGAPDQAQLDLAIAAAGRALMAAGDAALAQRRRTEPAAPRTTPSTRSTRSTRNTQNSRNSDDGRTR